MKPLEPMAMAGASTAPSAAVGTVAATPGETASESPEVALLVERAKGGDADAFGDLMHLYERRIIALGMQMGLSREDALDATQESFVKVFKYLASFKSGRSFFKWLYRIAIHTIYDALRARQARQTVALDEVEGGASLPSREAGVHQRLEAAQLAEKVRECLEHLSRRERIVFVLRDLQEISTEEIGAILGLSRITVRRHCMLARKRVRDRIFGPSD
ncbi:MAG TPA: sigma-70 family RNA polymerase sigma factor [Candidatus Polarisedimenticolia bacterium]|nr:sigma-70 family RNA polymerase sigma factor [Candidatus Polarisedimenticolia bacterium]